MRTLILATVSAVALGIAGAAPGYAQNTATTPGSTMAQPATPPGGTAPPSTPATSAAQPSTPSPGANAAAPQPATPTPGTNAQNMGNNPPAGTNEVRVTRGEIRQAQQKLHDQGLYQGRIDGMMGPETHQALRAYQQKNGLQVTARLDQQTLNHLLGGQGSSMPTTPAPSSAAGTNTSGGSWNSNNSGARNHTSLPNGAK
jgi:peptidoglycan hydrolase-like protein with peptidoglycan-binding domain